MTFKIQYTCESPFQEQTCLKSSNYPLRDGILNPWNLSFCQTNNSHFNGSNQHWSASREWIFSVDFGGRQLPQMISWVSINRRNLVHACAYSYYTASNEKFRNHSFIKTPPYNSYPGRPK